MCAARQEPPLLGLAVMIMHLRIDMRVGPRRYRFIRRIAAAAVMVLLCLGPAIPQAAAHAPQRFHSLDLVVLGDSFASGVGNVPYRDASKCNQSNDAFGPLLARTRLVTLQAFVACSGATTAQVWGSGPNGEPPQIDSITSETDAVAVLALGNDFYVGAIEALCFRPDVIRNCTVDTSFPSDHPLSGLTIGAIISSITEDGPDKLDQLYDRIDQKLRDVHSTARVITPDYPNIVGNGGPFCPGVSAEEVIFTASMVNALSVVIRDAARDHGYRHAPVGPLFRGHDACRGWLGIYPPLPPSFGFPASQDPTGGGALHPNRFGQTLYAAAVAKRLYF